MSGRRAKRLRKLARAMVDYQAGLPAQERDPPKRIAIALNYRVDSFRLDGRRKARRLAEVVFWRVKKRTTPPVIGGSNIGRGPGVGTRGMTIDDGSASAAWPAVLGVAAGFL